MSPSHLRAGEAWVRIAQALAESPEFSDRELSKAVVRYVRDMPVLREALARTAAQRELPGMTRSRTIKVIPTRRGPEMER